jgi:hypothetical protein
LATSFTGVIGATVTGTAVNDTTGADSKNEVKIDVDQATYVTQENKGTVVNEINLNANTGKNEANKNTGVGEVKTGDIATGVGVSTSMNLNVADVQGCGGCDLDLYAGNEKTGADSNNKAKIDLDKSVILEQSNYSYVKNNVDQKLNTGNNEANKNTGMGDISTGDIESVTLVDTLANKNMAEVGASGNGTAVLTAVNDTTGYKSDNKALIDVDLQNWATQKNFGYILNDVDVKANTGKNEANKNTGEGHIATGDIDTGIGLANTLNANFLAFDGCCDVELGAANVKTGADSKNKVKADLNSVNGTKQSNCEEEKRYHFFSFWNRGHQPKCGVTNLVYGDLNTGKNETNKNTADGIESGDIGAAVEVETQENKNVLGSPVWEWPEVELGELPEGAWWMLFFGVSA